MPSSTPPQQNFLPLPSPVDGQRTRINLGDIKVKLIKRIGPERTAKYFEHLQRFLSMKLSKTVFDNLCLTILGHENVWLHNHLIRSILYNACCTSGPPIVNVPKSFKVANSSNHVLVPPFPVCDNGDVPYQHVKDQHPPSRSKDASKWAPSLDNGEEVVQQNGAAHVNKQKRIPLHQQIDHVEPLAKRLHVGNASLDLFDNSNSDYPVGIIDRKKLEMMAHRAQIPVTAPLGVTFCSDHLIRNWKPTLSSSTGSGNSIGCYDLGQLCDTLELRKRMGKIAETEGLDGVSLECANLLNNGIDFFLKQLIGSCVELVRARSQYDRISHMTLQQQLSRKLNGAQLQNQVHSQTGSTHPKISSISLQDLKAVSELNPQLLGVNMSLLHEKMNSYD